MMVISVKQRFHTETAQERWCEIGAAETKNENQEQWRSDHFLETKICTWES